MKKNSLVIGLCVVLLGPSVYAGKSGMPLKRTGSSECLVSGGNKSLAAKPRSKSKTFGSTKPIILVDKSPFVRVSDTGKTAIQSKDHVIHPETGAPLNGNFNVKFKGSSRLTTGKIKGDFKNGKLIDGRVESKDGRYKETVRDGRVVGKRINRIGVYLAESELLGGTVGKK